jgi:uncharacterized protein YllA (UPF0747 family)
VAYFAQLSPLYKEVQIPMPTIYPRASVTIVEEKAEKVLERFSLSFLDLFQDLEIVKSRVASQMAQLNIEELFGITLNSQLELLEHIKEPLESVDPTLIGALDNTKKKVTTHLDALKEKAVAAQKRQHEVALRQIDKAANLVFPRSHFQERELNVLYFLNKYGLEFLRWLYDELKIDTFKHQIVKL